MIFVRIIKRIHICILSVTHAHQHMHTCRSITESAFWMRGTMRTSSFINSWRELSRVICDSSIAKQGLPSHKPTRAHANTHPHTHTHRHTHTHKYTYDYGRNCNTHLPQTHKKRTRQHRHRHKTHTHPPTHTSAHVSLRDTRVRTCRCIGAWESARPAHWHARSEQRRHAEGTDGAMARVSSSRRTC